MIIKLKDIFCVWKDPYCVHHDMIQVRHTSSVDEYLRVKKLAIL